jgi:hypothetical protein
VSGPGGVGRVWRVNGAGVGVSKIASLWWLHVGLALVFFNYCFLCL